MSGFRPSWLELREPCDRAARSGELVERLRRSCRDIETLRLIDLGAGTGANLRYLAPRLAGRQHWVLVDHDAVLLEAAARVVATWAEQQGCAVATRSDTMSIQGPSFACYIERLALDLGTELDRLPLDDDCVVTASALLDLVSSDWITELARCCSKRHALLYCALSYDGRMLLKPSDSRDELALDLFNRHQRTDKGFGAALGPEAVARVRDAFVAAGYRVQTRRSDWQLTEAHAMLQSELLAGWHIAVRDMEPARAAELDAWHERRRRLLAEARSRIIVGHEDLIAIPSRRAE